MKYWLIAYRMDNGNIVNGTYRGECVGMWLLDMIKTFPNEIVVLHSAIEITEEAYNELGDYL